MLIRGAQYLDGLYRVLKAPADSGDILAFQNHRLRVLVEHCYRSVPYYRKLFEGAGLRPEHIRTLDDLPKIPLTSRDDIQFLDPSELCAKGVNPESLLIRRTSGSSGAPLTIRRRWFEERLLLGIRLRSYMRLGLSLRTRRVMIEPLGSAAGWRRKLHDTPWQNRLGIFPKTTLDWSLPKDELVARLQKARPDIIAGPPSLLSWIADDLSPDDRKRVRPRLVIIGAETCTPGMWRQIERGFGAPIAEVYGSHEFVPIAYKGPRDSEFRIFGESVIAEVLNDEKPVGPGEDGEFTGTALHSFAMPFLRYRLGDLARRGTSNDAHPHSVSSLARVVGRTMDRFILASGRTVHPYTLATILRDEERWLRRFQIIQSERNRFLVRIVPYLEPGDQALAAARRKLEAVFAEPVDVRIDLVPDLLPAASGKFFHYVSLERFRQWGNPGEHAPKP